MRKIRIITLLALLTSFLLLIRLAPIFLRSDIIPVDDFSHFWASGRLWLAQQNPYDTANVLSLLEQAGARPTDSVYVAITLNPPWALLLFVPFCIFNYGVARVFWLITCIAILMISSQLLWMYFDGRKTFIWLAWLSAFIFGPTISVLTKGQITPWIIPAVTIFLLYTQGKSSPWLTGASLALLIIKPQLAFLLVPAIGIWILRNRQWKLIAAGLITLGLSTLMLWLITPNIFSQYLATMHTYPTSQWATPTIGSYMRLFWLGIDKFWIQYVPACLSLIWLVFHYYHRRQNWDWHREMPIVLLITSICNPYAWTYDQVILLPAVLAATHWLARPVNWVSTLLCVFFLVINMLDLLLHTRLDDFWFIWLAPAYALWYLCAIFWRTQRPSLRA